jgi:hypothetical protein
MQNTTGFRSFVASFAGVKGQRVKLNSSGGVDLADATNGTGIGTLENDCAAGEVVTVNLFAARTYEATVTGAVAFGALLYPAADGRLSPTSTASNTASFRALEAATAAGDLIEVMPILPGQ